MKKGTYKEAKALLEKWKAKLYLQAWEIAFTLEAKDIPPDDDGCTTNADISTLPIYQKATIRLFPLWAGKTPQEREAIIVHELCHCLTQGPRDLLNEARMGRAVRREEVRDAFELLTSRVAVLAFGVPKVSK